MTAIFAVTFVMSAVLICKWTLSHYDDDDDDDDDEWLKITVPACDVVYIYCSVVRSVLEYACAVWHPALSNKLSKDIERVQKRCLKIIYPKLSYSEGNWSLGGVWPCPFRHPLWRQLRVLLRNWNVLLIHCITCYHPARFPLLRWH